MIRGAVAAVTVILLAGCTADLNGPYVVSSAPATSSSASVPAAMLNPGVTQATISQTICRPGWTRTIRPKLPTRRGYENDHIVSLELGGSPANPLNLRFVPLTRARRDDVLENQLHRQVCAHQISLSEAQQQIIAAKQGE